MCQNDSKTQRRRSTRSGKRSQSESAVPAASDEPKRDRKRVRIGVITGQSGQHVIAALRKLERLPGRPPPGTLLLAQDPRSLNRYSPTIMSLASPAASVLNITHAVLLSNRSFLLAGVHLSSGSLEALAASQSSLHATHLWSQACASAINICSLYMSVDTHQHRVLAG